MSEIVLAVLLGFAAGGMSGLFGVGGGILFVPTLVLVLDLTQLSAQATSLAAMIPVVAVGAWRQHRYGNVRWRAALVVGLASAVGVAGGVVLADALGDVTLRRLFAALLVAVAAQLAWSARRA
ncbi:MAG: sulfite exporter TauE/SafE family protein [Gaiellaceae bacterium]